MKRALITGIAGDIGRSIVSILRLEEQHYYVVGTDIDENFPSMIFCDAFYKGIAVTHSQYINHLKDIIKKEKIDIIIPASEIEIRFFNTNKINYIHNVPVILADFTIMDIGFDKYATSNFLKEYGFPYPKTVIANEYKGEIMFPAIAKSRDGAGSKDILVVTKENMTTVIKEHYNWIIQEMLTPKHEEYTCGIFKTRAGKSYTIVFKRQLKSGRTSYAEVVDNIYINELLKSFCDTVNFYGSINIQLILQGNTPYIFEINPRFSSTVKFRHLLGFKDLIWSIEDTLQNEIDITFHPHKVIGKKIFRADQEIIY